MHDKQEYRYACQCEEWKSSWFIGINIDARAALHVHQELEKCGNNYTIETRDVV